MLVFFISDEKLLSFHMKRSNTLPDVIGYRESGNPIMTCLADQTKYDLEWKYCHFTDETLFESILTNLENGHLVWPGSIGINKNEWIQKTRKNPYWYCINKNGNADQGLIIDGENLLLSLASNYLKRKIQLIPIFKEGFKMFGKEFSNSKPYRLMSCQDAGLYNFFLSVLCKRNKKLFQI
jgi:hypothetical protein